MFPLPEASSRVHRTWYPRDVKPDTKAIDDTARLMKESIQYAQQLSEEFRKLSLENSKKAAELFTPKA